MTDIKGRDVPTFAGLLDEAITKPGTLSAAFNAFHDYSIGNAMAAVWQCRMRGIEPGPIGTYKRWREQGRHVKRGERALFLCMPVPGKVKGEPDPVTGNPTERTFTRFIWKPFWFVLSQTDGPTAPPPVVLPDWDEATALSALKIEKLKTFTHHNGNCLGFATGRKVAVSPLGNHPAFTLFHEMAHVVLGHTAKGEDWTTTNERPSYATGEVEAEGTAYIVASVLGLADDTSLTESRGYLSHWRRGADVPEKTAQRIFKAADAILRAGRTKPTESEVAA